MNDLIQSARDWRIVSLLFIFLSCLLADNITNWYYSISVPSNNQSAFAAAAMLSLVGVGKVWMETRAVCGESKISSSTLKFAREARIVTLSYIAYCWILAYGIIDWYMSLEAPTDGQSGFATSIIATVVGVVSFWMKTKGNTEKEE